MGADEATKDESHALKRLRELPNGTTLYTILQGSPARSGMTRWIDVYMIVHPTEGTNYDPMVRVWVPELGIKMDADKGYRMQGAGMDFGFALVYELGKLAHGDGYYFRHRWL